MADWNKTERTVTTTVYTVAADEPWGANWNQVQQALNAAVRDYNQYRGWVLDREPPDNAISVHAVDDVIVISWEKK
jgi:hypothetical protein